LKTTKNSGGNMYESFGLIGIQLPGKYKENFDVSSEGASTCSPVLLVFAYIVILIFYTDGIYDTYINNLKNEKMFAVKCGPNTTYTINSDRKVKLNFKAHT
jgi:hypothetical protein